MFVFGKEGKAQLEGGGATTLCNTTSSATVLRVMCAKKK